MGRKLSVADVKKFSQAQLQKYLSDPGRRSRLPSQFLTPELRAMREKNAAAKKQAALDAVEVVPDSGLTMGNLKRMLGYQEQLQYGSTNDEYARQRKQLGVNQERDSQWFDKYRQNVLDSKKTLDDANIAYNAANTGMISGAREKSNAADAAMADQLRARQEALNLGGPDQAAQYQQVASQAANSRDTVLRAQAMAAAERARGNSDSLGALATGTDAAKADALKRYLSANVDLDRKTDTLNKDKAAFREKILQKAMDDAQSRVIEKATVEAALQKTLSSNALSAAKLKADQKQKDRMYQLALQELGIKQQNANTNANRGSGGGSRSSGSKPTRATAAQIQAMSNRMDRVYSTVSKWKGKGWDHGRVRQRLIKTGKYTNLEIDVINDLLYRGRVSSTNRKRLHAQGYKLADFPRLK